MLGGLDLAIASPTSLGNIFRFDGEAESSFPTPAALNAGGVVYDLDAGLLAFSNGTIWTTLGPATNLPYLPVDGGTVTGPSSFTQGLTLYDIDAGYALNLENPVFGDTLAYLTVGRSPGAGQPSLCVSGGSTALDMYGFAQFLGFAYRTGTSGTAQCSLTGEKPLLEINTLNGTAGPIYTPQSFQLKGHDDAGVVTCSATFAGDLDYGLSNSKPRWCDGTNWNAISKYDVEAGRGAMTAGSLVVTFSQPFAATPVACVCSHESATPLACGISSTASTTAVTFAVTTGGTDTIDYVCQGRR